MMKRTVFVMAVFLVLAGVFTVMVRTEGIKEGKWSMTVVTKMAMPAEAAEAMKEMENMSPEDKAIMQQMMGGMGMQMGADAQGITTTVTQCISNDKPIPEMKNNENCQETHTMDGDTVNFHVVCNEDGTQTDSTGKVTYKEDSMQGTIQSKEMVEGNPTDVIVEITGQYVGPCS